MEARFHRNEAGVWLVKVHVSGPETAPKVGNKVHVSKRNGSTEEVELVNSLGGYTGKDGRAWHVFTFKRTGPYRGPRRRRKSPYGTPDSPVPVPAPTPAPTPDEDDELDDDEDDEDRGEEYKYEGDAKEKAPEVSTTEVSHPRDCAGCGKAIIYTEEALVFAVFDAYGVHLGTYCRGCVTLKR